MNTIRPPRQLAEITEEEVKECFRIAFGRDNTADTIALSPMSSTGITIRDSETVLFIWQDGIMYAHIENGEEPVFINAVRIVDYLRSIGIEFVAV